MLLPQQTAAHIRTIFLSNWLINQQKWPIIYQQTEIDVSFRAKNEPLWFPAALEVLVATCRPASLLLPFINWQYTESKIEVFYDKNWKIRLALKWATSNCTMLGIKFKSVNFPLRTNFFGTKHSLLLSDYQSCSSALSHVDADQIFSNYWMRLSRVWRIMQIEVDRPRWITFSKICIILHVLRKPNSMIAFLFIQNKSKFKNKLKMFTSVHVKFISILHLYREV